MATVEEEESIPMVCGGPQEHRDTTLSQVIGLVSKTQGHGKRFIGRAGPSPPFILPPPFSLKFGPMKSSQGIQGSAVSSPSGVCGKPQPTSYMVHVSFKICHLVAGYAVGLQCAVKKYWQSKMYSLLVGRANALPAYYDIAPLITTSVCCGQTFGFSVIVN